MEKVVKKALAKRRIHLFRETTITINKALVIDKWNKPYCKKKGILNSTLA